MPNKHAAIKDLRKNKKRAVHNSLIKTNVKHLLKKSVELVSKGITKETKETVLKLQQAIDKAAKLGIIDPNKAARKKSQLMKAVAAKK